MIGLEEKYLQVVRDILCYHVPRKSVMSRYSLIFVVKRLKRCKKGDMEIMEIMEIRRFD